MNEQQHTTVKHAEISLGAATAVVAAILTVASLTWPVVLAFFFIGVLLSVLW